MRATTMRQDPAGPDAAKDKSLDEPESVAAPLGARRPRVLIADKSPVVRAGLEDYIGRDPRFDVCGAVANGGAFASLVDERRIDVGVVGWALPDMTGGHLLGMLKRRQSTVRIIVYTGDANTDVLREAVREGAWGFTSKSEDPAVLLDTIASVAKGRMSVPYIDIRTIASDPLDALTARERELLAALANGWTNLQIAARIGISANTVKYHLKNLYDKLGVNNRAMAVAMYMSNGRDQR
jgi:DNA-binding NarL/FixJ family response regulator